MRTNWFGSFLIQFVACLLCAGIGFGGATYLHHQEMTKLNNESFVLEKEHWHCFVGKLFDTGFECFVYKRKDADFGPHPNSRRGDDNIPKGKPVQQTQ